MLAIDLPTVAESFGLMSAREKAVVWDRFMYNKFADSDMYIFSLDTLEDRHESLDAIMRIFDLDAYEMTTLHLRNSNDQFCLYDRETHCLYGFDDLSDVFSDDVLDWFYKQAEAYIKGNTPYKITEYPNN